MLLIQAELIDFPHEAQQVGGDRPLIAGAVVFDLVSMVQVLKHEYPQASQSAVLCDQHV